VTRVELLDAVWPGLAVAPETLTQVIAELRQALGDDARHPRFVETAHRRGFRFMAGVQPARDGGIFTRIALGPRGKGAGWSGERPSSHASVRTFLERLL
jgi:DNA-binding winged helix-turn-helix (wHTH) protein